MSNVIEFRTVKTKTTESFLAQMGLTFDQAMALSEYEKDALQADYEAWQQNNS